jgi:benzodiazapine receptor
MVYRVIAFLVLNFAALALGSLFTKAGVSSEWYASLAKAPWTPPGWVFGFAWTTIMICFSFYMASLWKEVDNRKNLIVLFVIQWILNVSWNPIFFYYHLVLPALVGIVLLTMVVGFMAFYYRSLLKLRSIYILPYFVWLLIATSLNGYIFFQN